MLFSTRDHRKLLVGDFRGRIYSWSVTDAAGTNELRFVACEVRFVKNNFVRLLAFRSDGRSLG